MASNIVKYILEITDKGASKSLKDVSKASEQTTKDLKQVEKQSKSTSATMKKLAKSGSLFGAAIAAAGAALAAFGQSQADTINSLNDLSTRSGVASDQILALKFAFVASGQAADSVQGLLDKMPKMMGELARGTGSASIAAERLGVSVFDAGGKIKDSSDLFIELTAELQKIESGTERATVAAELFGRQAGNMLQAFGQTEGLQTFLDFTREYGVSVGKKATLQAAQFQQAVAALDLVFQKLLQTFGLVFGERGFIEPIKLAGKAIVFMTANLEDQINNIPIILASVLNRMQALVLKFALGLAVAFEPILDLLGLAGLEEKVQSGRVKIQKQLSQLNQDFEVDLKGLQVTSFQKAAAFDKDFEELLSTLQKQGHATGTVIENIGTSAEDAAKEAAKAWKEFGDVLDDFVDVDFAEPFEQIGDAMLIVANQMEKHFERIVDNIEKTAGLISSIASGDIMGGVQQFLGPIGSAIAETVGSISGLGGRIAEEQDQLVKKMISNERDRLQKQVEAGEITQKQADQMLAQARPGIEQRAEQRSTEFIKLDIENFVRGFVIGLSHLPAILIEVLPPLLFEAAGRIVVAIIQLPFHIAKAVKDAVKGLGDVIDERRKRRQEEGIGANTRRNASRLAEFLVQDVMMGGGSFIPKAANGMRFTGNKRGLAMLHEGEFVVPQSGRQSQAVMRQMSQSGGINIVINADVVERNAIDELVRRIERRFDLFGTSTSPLFSQG